MTRAEAIASMIEIRDAAAALHESNTTPGPLNQAENLARQCAYRAACAPARMVALMAYFEGTHELDLG